MSTGQRLQDKTRGLKLPGKSGTGILRLPGGRMDQQSDAEKGRWVLWPEANGDPALAMDRVVANLSPHAPHAPRM